MTVNDVLTSAVEYMNLDKTLLTAPESEVADKLLFCLNSVYRQTKMLYMPAKELQNIKVVDGKIPYSKFSKPPLNVFSVTQGGASIAFRAFPTFLMVEANGSVEVCFSYQVPMLGKDSEMGSALKLSAETLAYGVCAEYAFINGLYEKADAFENKFKEALRNINFDGREKTLRKMRWY